MKSQQIIIISKHKIPIGDSVTVESKKYTIKNASNEQGELKKVVQEIEQGSVYRHLVQETTSW